LAGIPVCCLLELENRISGRNLVFLAWFVRNTFESKVTRGQHVEYACSINYHNASTFGLGFKDCKTLGSKEGVKRTMPSQAAVKANSEHIDKIIADICDSFCSI